MNDLKYEAETKLNLESRYTAALLCFNVTWAILQMHKTFSRNALFSFFHIQREREREREREIRGTL